MIWGPMSSVCRCWSTMFYKVQSRHSLLPVNFRMLSSADKLGLGTCPLCQKYQYRFNDHGITTLDQPTNWPNVNPIEHAWIIVKKKMRYTGSNNPNLGFLTSSTEPQVDCLHATLP
ncbi:hypothetical protein CHARACLAT_018055 [Characodon lateralis]|uniref:Tc1-like transposase DDE domain-containing protein n=1 Tax=Characodon lateralis TaxID=208331 RepID=A0ABU7CP63_9TELE|nr:hypothetical protein [Characodon lateralis]